MNELHYKLANAVTEYDRQQSKRRGYNPNALGMYLGAVSEVCEMVGKGKDVRLAISRCFNDRLLDVCLEAINGR